MEVVSLQKSMVQVLGGLVSEWGGSGLWRSL